MAKAFDRVPLTARQAEEFEIHRITTAMDRCNKLMYSRWFEDGFLRRIIIRLAGDVAMTYTPNQLITRISGLAIPCKDNQQSKYIDDWFKILVEFSKLNVWVTDTRAGRLLSRVEHDPEYVHSHEFMMLALRMAGVGFSPPTVYYLETLGQDLSKYRSMKPCMYDSNPFLHLFKALGTDKRWKGFKERELINFFTIVATSVVKDTRDYVVYDEEDSVLIVACGDTIKGGSSVHIRGSHPNSSAVMDGFIPHGPFNEDLLPTIAGMLSQLRYAMTGNKVEIDSKEFDLFYEIGRRFATKTS